MKKLVAEFVGTAVLVLFGCGAAVLGGDSIGQTGIAFAFGLAIVAMAYGIGPVSGCHVNPAVSLGVFISGRMSAGEMIRYWIAQFAGALAGAAILAVIAGSTANLGQNGWGPGYLGEYALPAALIFEVVFTAIFVVVILGSTGKAAAAGFAGLAIGLTLTAIHLVGIQVTGVSVNPARSFGPALLAGGQALSQLWLFIVAPLAGGLLGALFFRFKLLED
ncbi:aquaporin [Martelella radicis]|uniref:Aquaporin Z n=1 Tax=Martelella radicis TaxID=1397476 RepID=A0A7W6P8J8_9HYPH|nr:aquaporin [Martelella radicis]MBB4121327.1 aquaporin Z [Martelella radicis]